MMDRVGNNEHVKLLGIHFTTDHKWQREVDAIYAKAKGKTYAIFMLKLVLCVLCQDMPNNVVRISDLSSWHHWRSITQSWVYAEKSVQNGTSYEKALF